MRFSLTRFLSACSLLAIELALAGPVLEVKPAMAWPFRGTARTTCLQSGFIATDGCLAAPAHVNSTLSFRKNDLLTDTTGGFFQSGQATSGISKITWNMAGKDYDVGVSMTGPYNGVVVNGITVNGSWCNNGTVPCSTRNGAEGLIDPTAYNYTTDPAHWGCTSGSGYSTATLNIQCLALSTGVVNIDIEGVDFFVGGVCHTIYVNNGSGSNSGSFHLSNFYWKYSNSVGTTNGCLNPVQANPIRVNFGNNSTINNLVDYGIVDQDIPNSGIISQDTIWLHSGGSGAVRYVAGLNLNSRVARIDSCNNQETSFVVANPAGYYPSGNHFEFALLYPTRYFDLTCKPAQKVFNNTTWTNAVTNSPANTSPISTGQPTSMTVTASLYDVPTKQLTLTVSGLGSTFPLNVSGNIDAGTWVMVNSVNGTDKAKINGLSFPIVSGNTTTLVLDMTSIASSCAGGCTFGTGTIFGNNNDSLDLELNNIALNKIGGAAYYYALGETAPVPVTGNKGTGFAKGDIVQINDSCSTSAQITIASVNAATGTINNPNNPSPGDTVSLGGTTVTFVASGATGNQVNIRADATATALALQTFASASADANIVLSNYTVSGTTLTVTYKLTTSAGNSFAIASTVTGAVVSGATLSGGSSVNTIASYTGGVCNSNPGTSLSNPGAGPFSTTAITGSGTGLQVQSAGFPSANLYQFATAGYGIQPGQATYLTSFKVSNNAVDATGAAASINYIVYQRTNCPGTSTAAGNFSLTTGAAITSLQITNTTCATS